MAHTDRLTPSTTHEKLIEAIGRFPSASLTASAQSTDSQVGVGVPKEGSEPLISVLVPVYNVERYLQEALESIAAQTYRNLEVIVVDDGSSDRTYAIARDFARGDARFVVHRNSENLRIAKTLNRALHLAKGTFIARCDGDDVMMPDRIARQLEHLYQNPHIGLVGCSFHTINEYGVHLRDVHYPSGHVLVARLLRWRSPVSHIWLARREVYDAVGEYRLASVEDYDFLLRANAAGYHLDNINGYFGMKIRMRAGNTVSRFGIVQRRLFNHTRRVNLTTLEQGPIHHATISEDNLVQRFRSGPIAKLHYLSDIFSNIATQSSSKPFRYLMHGISGITSPFKAQYYYFTLRGLILERLIFRKR